MSYNKTATDIFQSIAASDKVRRALEDNSFKGTCPTCGQRDHSAARKIGPASAMYALDSLAVCLTVPTSLNKFAAYIDILREFIEERS